MDTGQYHMSAYVQPDFTNISKDLHIPRRGNTLRRMGESVDNLKPGMYVDVHPAIRRDMDRFKGAIGGVTKAKFASYALFMFMQMGPTARAKIQARFNAWVDADAPELKFRVEDDPPTKGAPADPFAFMEFPTERGRSKGR